MATKLQTTVRRELIGSNRYTGTLIVELQPGDVLEFREKGTRRRYDISLHNVFLAAVMNTRQRDHAQRVKQWEAAGKRGRRPKAPNYSHMPGLLRRAISTR